MAVYAERRTPLAALFEPRLSAIRIDIQGMGRCLAALALGAVEGTPRPEAGPELQASSVSRARTGPAS